MAQQLTRPTVIRGGTYRMTFEEFLEAIPDGWRAEWVDGEVYVFMSTFTRHADFFAFLFLLIGSFVERMDLGRTSAGPYSMRVRGGGSWREPDIMVLLTEHADRVTSRNIEGPVDFVVELVSDDSVTRDRRDKYLEYAAVGVPEYVIIDAREGREGFEFFRLNEQGRYAAVRADDEGRFHSEVLPGLWLEAGWFRSDPLPKVGPLVEQMVARMSD